jgi:hypothetical protein
MGKKKKLQQPRPKKKIEVHKNDSFSLKKDFKLLGQKIQKL